MDKEDECNELGETCYDFTGLWCDDCVEIKLLSAITKERTRIEGIFKELVPPHAMELSDAVWLKRLLNKAFIKGDL